MASSRADVHLLELERRQLAAKRRRSSPSPRRTGGSRAWCTASRSSCDGVPGRGIRGRERPPESAPPRRSSPRCPCRARGRRASGRRPRSPQRAAVLSRSSEFAATPPPSATALHPPPSTARSSLAISWPTTRRLIARGKVGETPLNLLRVELAGRVQERRLQPAETEVEARVSGHPDREGEGSGIAFGGGALDRRPARVAQTQQPWRPCRAPPRPRRRASARAPRSRLARARPRAGCAPRSRSGTGTADRGGRARGSWRRRAPADGSRLRGAFAWPPPAISRWRPRPGARRSGPARG